MSWDVFIQELPAGVTDVADIPADFRPGPIGARSEIIRAIEAIAPHADFSDPAWGKIDGATHSIEVNIGDDETVQSIALHVSGGESAADLVADIVEGLGVAALDPGAPGGVFTREGARASLTGFNEYADDAVRSPIDWSGYYDKVESRPPRDTATRLVELGADKTGLVADLGCGDGAESLFLAEAGWRVLAIDAEAEAINRVTARAAAIGSNAIEGRVMSFSDLALPAVDAVHASYSLPFCHPEDFDAMWSTIVDAVRPGGLIALVFFGVNDTWANTPDMTFQTRAQVESLLEGFEVIELIEVEEDGEASSGPKHWHTLTVYARKRA